MLTERHHVDRKTGKKSTLYFYKDKNCPTVIIDTPVARKLAGYHLIKIDLYEAKEWLQNSYKLLPKHLNKTSKKDRYLLSPDNLTSKTIRAFWFSAIIIYAKCFSSTEGRYAKLERKNLPNEYLVTHDQIIRYRNTIVAHAGETHHEYAQLRVVLPPNKKINKVWLRPDIKQLDFADDRSEAIPFEKLIDQVTLQVNEKIEALKKRLFDKEILNLGKEYWYQQAKLHNNRNLDGTVTE